MGTYPSFSFSPDDTAVIIWAAGHIYSVPLAVNKRGERIASSSKPYPIRFIAHIEKQLAETRRSGFNILDLERQDTQKVRAFKELRVDESGKKVVFQAAGVTYWHQVGGKAPQKVPVLYDASPYYSPSFVYGQDNLVIHIRWSDAVYSKLEVTDIKSGKAYEITGLPMGRYFSPILCECRGSRRTLAFLKSDGSYLSGDILATAQPGLYIADIILPDSASTTHDEIKVSNIRFIPSEISTSSFERVNMRFINTNRTLLVQQSTRAFTIDLSSKPDKQGKPLHTTLATGATSSALLVSPVSTKKGTIQAENIAFVDFFNVYLAPGDRVKEGEAVWSRPANATKGLTRLSLDGGHDVTWSLDGKTLFWFLGTC